MEIRRSPEEMIKWLYTNNKSPVMYGSERQLFTEAKKYKITATQVKNYLHHNSTTYNTHKQTRVNFPREKITTSTGLHTSIQMDLADMRKFSHSNANRKWILVVWDVYSRKIFAEPVFNKKPPSILRAFLTIRKRDMNNDTILIITHDDGTEFRGEFKTAIRKMLIEQRIAPHSAYKTAGAERAIRSIKTRLFKYMTGNSDHKWLAALQISVRSLNNLPKRSLGGRSASSVTRTNKLDIPIPTETRSLDEFIYKVGDRVRVRYDMASVGYKGYEAKYNPQTFLIAYLRRNTNVPCYRLMTIKQEPISGNFYHSELTFATKKQDGHEVSTTPSKDKN